MKSPKPCRAAVCAALALASTPALAQEPVRHVSFAWVRGDGADGCPAQPALMAAVRARINRDPFSESATVTAEASVARVEGRWRARLTFRDAQGAVLLRRDLEDGSDDCTTIANAVALSVSLGLAPSVDDEPRAVDREVAPRVVLGEAPVRPAPPVETRERAWSTLAAEVLHGVLPGLALGVVWRLDVPLARRWSVWVSASFNPQVSVGDANEWTFGLKRASAGACFRFRPRAWLELAPCAGLSVGAVNAVTYGLAPVDPGEYLWPAVVLVPRVTLRPWRRLVLEATLSAAVVAPNAREFSARRGDVSVTIYKQDDVAFGATLGLGVEF